MVAVAILSPQVVVVLSGLVANGRAVLENYCFSLGAAVIQLEEIKGLRLRDKVGSLLANSVFHFVRVVKPSTATKR